MPRKNRAISAFHAPAQGAALSKTAQFGFSFNRSPGGKGCQRKSWPPKRGKNGARGPDSPWKRRSFGPWRRLDRSGASFASLGLMGKVA